MYKCGFCLDYLKLRNDHYTCETENCILWECPLLGVYKDLIVVAWVFVSDIMKEDLPKIPDTVKLLYRKTTLNNYSCRQKEDE